MAGTNGLVSSFLFLIYSKVKELSDLTKTETLTTVSLQFFRSLAKILLARQDPVAVFIAGAEKKWPEVCPAMPLQARISTIQIVLGVLKVCLS